MTPRSAASAVAVLTLIAAPAAAQKPPIADEDAALKQFSPRCHLGGLSLFD